MTTQVRPSSGGAWNNVSLDSRKIAKKDTTYGTTLSTSQLNRALFATNQWVNCAGIGTAATRSQKTMAAIGLSLQEV